jgi:hypothetical protein
MPGVPGSASELTFYPNLDEAPRAQLHGLALTAAAVLVPHRHRSPGTRAGYTTTPRIHLHHHTAVTPRGFPADSRGASPRTGSAPDTTGT